VGKVRRVHDDEPSLRYDRACLGGKACFATTLLPGNLKLGGASSLRDWSVLMILWLQATATLRRPAKLVPYSLQSRLPSVSPAETIPPAHDYSRRAAWPGAIHAILVIWAFSDRGESPRSFCQFACLQLGSAASGQGMKLHRQVAHAGSSGWVDPAESPDRRGWLRRQISSDRTSEEDKYGVMKPNYD